MALDVVRRLLLVVVILALPAGASAGPAGVGSPKASRCTADTASKSSSEVGLTRMIP